MSRFRSLGAVGLFAAALVLPGKTMPAQERTKVELAFRYDDYSGTSPFDFETRLIHLFEQHKTPLAVGVIPFTVKNDYHDPRPQPHVPLNEERAAVLREGIAAGTLEVAQHGWSHQTNRTFALGRHSEFGGLPPDEIDRRIGEGKAYLEKLLDQKITMFIPPWNVSDRTLLASLEKHGFTGLSLGFEGGQADPKEHLHYIASTVDAEGVYSAIKSARETGCPWSVIVVLIHPDDFIEVDPKAGIISLEKFSTLLDDLAKEHDVTVVRLSDILARPQFDANLFRRNKIYFHTQDLIYPWIGEILGLQNDVYFCSEYLNKALPKAQALLAIYVLAILVVSFTIGYKAGRILFGRWRWMPLLGCALTFLGLSAIVMDIMLDWDISYKGLTGTSMFLGFLIGELVALFALQRRERES